MAEKHRDEVDVPHWLIWVVVLGTLAMSLAGLLWMLANQ